MSRTLLPLSLLTALIGGAALADVPRVTTDIAPTRSLVARVMDGVGAPDLIVQPGGCLHEYSLRPSEAKALQEADLVFWVSPDLTPWLGNTIETLATNASATELLQADGTIELTIREGALFEVQEHDEDEREGAEHEGDDHAEHADEHAEEEAGHEGHGDSAHDPHTWLSLTNSVTWLNVIAGQLSAIDPENSGAYFANAAVGRAELDTLTSDINAMLEPVRGGQFIVFHDAVSTLFLFDVLDLAKDGDCNLEDKDRTAIIAGEGDWPQENNRDVIWSWRGQHRALTFRPIFGDSFIITEDGCEDLMGRSISVEAVILSIFEWGYGGTRNTARLFWLLVV